MENNDIITLGDDLLIGEGGNRFVYINPENRSQCIKIHKGKPKDHLREMKYRKSRELRHLPDSPLMVDYYGTVKTNLGTGYVFERVFDYDDATSKTIDDLIKLEIQAREEKSNVQEMLDTEKKIPLVTEVLFRFRESLFKDNIIIPDMGAFNYVVQFDSPTNWRVRIVDDLGSPTLIPIVYYIDYLGAKHVRRRWNKFIREIMDDYPNFLSEKESMDLMTFK